MGKVILAVLEQRENKLKKSAYEVVTTAVNLAKELGLEAKAIIIGNDVENLDEVAKYGIADVTLYKNADLSNYSPSAYSNIVAEYGKGITAEYILFADTALGKDLAPRVAVKLNAGCLIDCVHLQVSDGSIIATRPIYAGKALMDIKLKSEIKIITIRPNVFKAHLVEGTKLNLETKSA